MLSSNISNNDAIKYLQKKSERNKVNSSKKKTKSTQGSLSYLAHRYINVSYSNFVLLILHLNIILIFSYKLQSKEDGTLGSALETWKKKHHNKKGEWTTDWARQAYVSYFC